MKRKYKSILLFISLFTIIFIINCFKKDITLDEIWNYGFAYNIRNGMVPYKDFNIILTPLYSYILALFIMIFGNTIFSIIVFNSIISSIIEYCLIKKHGTNGLLYLPIIISISFNSYNLLSLMLFMFFIYINNSKYTNNQFLIGFIVSLMLLTKQSIGGLILISSFIFSKSKIKYLIGFSPMCLLFLFYLILTNSVYNFFNYCLFEMFDFTNNNGFAAVDYTIIFFIISFITIIYLLIKDKFHNQELIYILFFQIMAFPIFDFYHITIAMIPFLSYLQEHKSYKIIINNLKTYTITFLSIMTLVITIVDVNNNAILYHNNNSFLNKHFLPININYIVYNLNDEIINNYNGYKEFHLYEFAYLYKLELNEPINKFDLNNKGNMGYDGENKWIKEIDNDCKSNKCLIILDHYKEINPQISMKINNYIINNYKFEKTIGLYDLYTNNEKITDET